MARLVDLCAVFVGALLAKLEAQGVLERVANSLVRVFIKNTQPQYVEAAKEGSDDEAFVRSAEAGGWGRDSIHSGGQP